MTEESLYGLRQSESAMTGTSEDGKVQEVPTKCVKGYIEQLKES